MSEPRRLKRRRGMQEMVIVGYESDQGKWIYRPGTDGQEIVELVIYEKPHEILNL